MCWYSMFCSAGTTGLRKCWERKTEEDPGPARFFYFQKMEGGTGMRPLVRQFALTSHQERSAAGSGSCFRCAAGGFVRLVAWCWLAGAMQRRRQQMELFPAGPHQSPEENATAAAQPEPVNLSTWQLHQVEHRPPCPAIQDGSSYTRKKAGRRSLDNRRGCRICLPWCSRPDGRTADTTPGLVR